MALERTDWWLWARGSAARRCDVARRVLLAASFVALAGPGAASAREMRLCNTPALSPDGETLAVEWNGDLWVGDSAGGAMRRLTASPAVDTKPTFSPDGRRLAFESDRSGRRQVYVMPIEGGEPRRVTFHSEGSTVEDWTPDGKRLLTVGVRDHFWTKADRLITVPVDGDRIDERVVLNGHAASGRFAGGAGRVVFTRFGEPWWRQGYRGGRATQAWMLDVAEGSVTRIGDAAGGVRSPRWHAASNSVLYLSNADGPYNLWRRGEDGEDEKLTAFDDGLVSAPCVATDAGVCVFRRQFDLYRLDLSDVEATPQKLTLTCRDEVAVASVRRLTLERATELDFVADGAEVAMIVDNDLWVMSTADRHPRQVTATSSPESDPLFDPDGERLAFIAEADGRVDIWIAARADAEKGWAENTRFETRRLTDDDATQVRLRWSPSGDRIAYATEQGELIVRRPDEGTEVVLYRGWDDADFQWSSTGEWICYAASDSDFNSDVFIVRADGSAPPINVSCHPDDDYDPVWSPNGKRLAFVGARENDERDLFVIDVESLTTEASGDESTDSLDDATLAHADVDSIAPSESSSARRGWTEACDHCFDGPIVRLRNPDVQESNPVWSPDSDAIAFTGRSARNRDTYKVVAEAGARPRRWTGLVGYGAEWTGEEKALLWRADGRPAKLEADGDHTEFTFKVYQERCVTSHYEAIIDHCWRVVRDTFYDPGLHGQDWDGVRRRYRPLARHALGPRMLAQLVNMMLGELRASHQGFRLEDDGYEPDEGWRPTTYHPAVWFRGADDLTVAEIAEEAEEAGVEIGDRVTHVNGRPVNTRSELDQAFTGPPNADFSMRVVNKDGEARTVEIDAIRYRDARSRYYELWVKRQRRLAAELSEGRLGYIHLRDMMPRSIPQFERELYAAGHGREGLVIDVRYNGGGRITDHLLSMLSHPQHAVTTPRGGEPGYPQSRRFYASWNRPIALLVNGASNSNAEVFSRAIKTTRRGPLVGEVTAGNVISASSRNIMGMGNLRIAFRGWREAGTGEPMEGTGVTPDFPVEAAPADLPSGRDPQLEVAVERLLSTIDAG